MCYSCRVAVGGRIIPAEHRAFHMHFPGVLKRSGPAQSLLCSPPGCRAFSVCSGPLSWPLWTSSCQSACPPGRLALISPPPQFPESSLSCFHAGLNRFCSLLLAERICCMSQRQSASLMVIMAVETLVRGGWCHHSIL